MTNPAPVSEHPAIQSILRMVHDMDPQEQTRVNRFFAGLFPEDLSAMSAEHSKKLVQLAERSLAQARTLAQEAGGIGWADPIAKLSFVRHLLCFIEASTGTDEAIFRARTTASLLNHWRETGDLTFDRDERLDRTLWAGIRISIYRAVNAVHVAFTTTPPAEPQAIDDKSTPKSSPAGPTLFATEVPRNIELN